MLVEKRIANSLSCAFWLQPVSLIWLGACNDDSIVSSSRGFAHGYFARWSTRLGFQYCHLFTPLQALMASRKPGGDAVTPAPGGRVLHPHGHSVIIGCLACASFTKPAIPKYYYLFRQNESHLFNRLIPCSGRISWSLLRYKVVPHSSHLSERGISASKHQSRDRFIQVLIQHLQVLLQSRQGFVP